MAVVILDSVHSITLRYGALFDVLEWAFTLLFTIEYLLRLACVRRPLRYATSFFGIVDLLAVLPTYLAFFVPEAHALIDVRMLRLLRIFRILNLGAYVSEFGYLGAALMASRRKIIVFIGFVLISVDAHGMGHPGRAHRHRHCRDDRPPHCATRHHARVSRLPDRRPRSRCAVLQALRQAPARVPG